MKEPTLKKFTYFIGIDVSKNELDYAVMCGRKFLFHREAENRPEAIITFAGDLKKLPKFVMSKAVFCMENTGIYCNHLLASLRKLKANIVVENPLQIRNSLGVIRGKNDKIDAIRIAHYAYKNKEELKLISTKRPVILQLANLFSLRTRLINVQQIIKSPLAEQRSFVKKGLHKESAKGCKKTLKAVLSDIERIEAAVAQIIKSDDRLRRLNEIIMSVPGVGWITAVHVIISTNEFQAINNPKKFACYSGIAPFPKESGNVKAKARVSNLANKKLKSLLHTCAVQGLRFNPEFKEYFTRKSGEGKAKMAIINAIRNKIVLRIFACVMQDRLYQKGYQRLDPAC